MIKIIYILLLLLILILAHFLIYQRGWKIAIFGQPLGIPGLIAIFMALSISLFFIPTSKVTVEKTKTLNVNTNTNKFRLTNDELSNISATDILKKYSQTGKERYKDIFGDNKISKDYALTLVGKVIPSTVLKDVDKKDIELNKGKSIVYVMNLGDESTKFIKEIKEISDKSINQVMLFPTEKTEKVQDWLKDKDIPKSVKVATYENNVGDGNKVPDLLSVCQYYFNVVGAPSYVALDEDTIVLAANGSDKGMYKSFLNNAFSKPYLHKEVKSR